MRTPRRALTRRHDRDTRELENDKEPNAPSSKRPDPPSRPDDTDPIPEMARLDYVAPDGSTDTGKDRDDGEGAQHGG